MKNFLFYLLFVLIALSACRRECGSVEPSSVSVMFRQTGSPFTIRRIQGVGNDKIVPMQTDSMALVELKMNDTQTAYVIEQASDTDTIVFNTLTSARYRGRRCGYSQITEMQSVEYSKNGINTIEVFNSHTDFNGITVYMK